VTPARVADHLRDHRLGSRERRAIDDLRQRDPYRRRWGFRDRRRRLCRLRRLRQAARPGRKRPYARLRKPLLGDVFGVDRRDAFAQFVERHRSDRNAHEDELILPRQIGAADVLAVGRVGAGAGPYPISTVSAVDAARPLAVFVLARPGRCDRERRLE
jgi:hypothetical protein